MSEATFTVEGNRATAESGTPRIRTLDDLIEACKIDLDVWQVEKLIVNNWEGYRADKDVDLEFENGVMTGHVRDEGEIKTKTLYKIEARFIRIEPIALQPVIQPIEIKIRKGTLKGRRMMKQGRMLVVADPHFGFRRDLESGELENFHDRRALSVVSKFAKSLQFERIVVLGDVLDLAEWSDKFLRSPEMYWTTQPAINEAASWLAELRITTERMDVLEGNHENRLTKALITHMKEAYGLKPADAIDDPMVMSVPYLLGLESMDVGWVGDYPKGSLQVNERLELVHGDMVRKNPGQTVGALLQHAWMSVGCGHGHRNELATKRIGERVLTAFMVGCLCRLDGAVPGSSKKSTWQQGFGVIEYGTDWETVNLYPIEDGSAVYGGVRYVGDG